MGTLRVQLPPIRAVSAQAVTIRFARFAVELGQVALWAALICPLIFLLGPVALAALHGASCILQDKPLEGVPLKGNEDLCAFTSKEDAAEMLRRGIDSELPILRRITAEYICQSSAVTAVLLQIAQSGVGRGVGRHSNLSTRLLERYENTAAFVYLNIFGNNTERHVIRNFVNKIHAKVNDKRTNKTYDAFDPNLQLWVAATMYVCMLGSHQRVYGPLPEHEQEQVYQEFSVFGTSLQMPLSMWPDSRAAFASYWNDTIATLKVPNEAHNAVRDLFQPKYHKLPILVAVIMALLRPFSIAVASEELPGHVAVQFGFRSTWQTKALYKLMTTFNQWTFPLYPVWVRHMQKNYYLHTVRERMVNKGMMKNGKHVSTSSLGV